MRGAMKAGTAIQTALSEVREELSDVAAEARSELAQSYTGSADPAAAPAVPKKPRTTA